MKMAGLVVLASGLMLLGGCMGMHARQSGHEGHAPPAAAQGEARAAKEGAVVRCAVTGEEVPDPAQAPKSEYQGKTYYFCCAPCKVDFDRDPEKYLKQQK